MATHDDVTLSADQVRHVAALARIAVSDDEVASLSRDLTAILGYVAKLEELDTADVPPSSHAVTKSSPLRADVVQPGLPRETSLEGAPEPLNHGFGVPKVIDAG